MPNVDAEKLKRWAAQMLAAGGAADDEARIVAESLIGSNLRGHDSHGIVRVAQYVGSVAAGETVAGADATVLRDTDALLMLDGNWGFGQVQMQRLAQRLIEKAKSAGVAVGTLIHAAHVGRLGEYCEMAAREGLVAMMMVNNHGCASRVAPPGGKAPRLGTNPIAIAVPNGKDPLVVDFGTSATAEGKVRIKRIAGQPCPDGWLIDSEGRPTNDPNVIYQKPEGTIRPLGGDQAYKGFGLSLMIEILSGALSGGVCARETPINQLGNCAFLQLYDPAAMGGADHFRAETSRLIDFVRSCPTIDGVDRITLPGDPELRTMAERLKSGVPIDQGNWDALVSLSERLGVAPPAV